jgi:hypothetical protein
MKIKRLTNLRPVAFCALGVFLGRGAQADTIVDFDTVPGPNNAAIDQSFGDNAAASSDGVTVDGFGTPNIGLTWAGSGDPATRWEYYNDSVWSAGQLNHSVPGTANEITFAPDNTSVSVVVKSFNFHPYYESTERFTFNVSILSGTNVLTGPTNVTFLSDATKNHPVNLNYTGAPNQTLTLRLARVASTLAAGEVEGAGGDIAVDDIRFAQLPEIVVGAGPQVVSVTPANGQSGVAAISYSYLASITNGTSTLVASSIQLKFDGTPVAPPPIITSADGVTNVSYSATNLLTSGSIHTYTLTYADNLDANYTNEAVFTVVNYPTLPSAYGSPPGSGITPGFTYRTVAAPQDTTTNMDSTIARAQAQLDGTLIDPSTSMPYTNVATLGTNADGSFNIDTVLNFNDNGSSAGNFPDDEPFPGLDPAASPYNWFSTEALLYLELPAGYYRFGVNSDDGFEVNVIPPQGSSGSPIQLGIFNNGRAADDTLFDFLVQTSGVYHFQVIYFESAGDASCEFYSVTNLVTEDKVLINDLSNPNAIKSYRAVNVVPVLRITNIIVQSGTNAVLEWADGTPPFQVQFKTNLTDAVWSDSGSTTTNRTASIPIQTSTGFFRVFGQ